MKKGFLLFIVFLALAAAAVVVQQTSNIFILNTDDGEIKLKIRSAATQTAPLMELVKGATAVFSVSADGILSVSNAAGNRSALGLAESGTNIVLAFSVTTSADGSTTQAFATAFSAAPMVFPVQTGINTTITNSITVTTTNFILTTAKASQVVKCLVFGAP
jgi:P pilus assembly chaperone PapD